MPRFSHLLFWAWLGARVLAVGLVPIEKAAERFAEADRNDLHSNSP